MIPRSPPIRSRSPVPSKSPSPKSREEELRHHGRPEAQDEPFRDPLAQIGKYAAGASGTLAVPELRCVASFRTGCAATVVGTEVARSSTSSSGTRPVPPVIAIDAMGGDRAPAEIVAGALARPSSSTSTCCSSGPADAIRAASPRRRCPPARSRSWPRPRSSPWMRSPPRRFAPRRIPRSCGAPRRSRTAGGAMVGAGNTGATMAAALLRFGRIKGVHRPAIARSLARLRCRSHPTARRRRRDGRSRSRRGSSSGRAGARLREGPSRRRRTDVGLLSNGEEPGKGDALRKAAWPSAFARSRDGSATSKAAT